MRTATTGGSGGVGQATIRAALAAGHSALSLDRAEPKPGAVTVTSSIACST